MAGKRANLHVHTTASDGLLSPARVVLLARQKRVDCIAITDHDSVSGITEAMRAGKKHGVEVIPGIEMSSEYEHKSVHVLGYFIDVKSRALLSYLKKQKQRRDQTARKMVSKINALHICRPISYAQLKKLANGTITKSHIADAMIFAGAAGTKHELITKYLLFGKKAYVPRDKITPFDAVRLIRSAGGIPVIAHPGFYENSSSLINRLAKRGLLGIEVFFPLHSTVQRKKFLKLAVKNRLVATGGSDFHAQDSRDFAEGGSMQVSLVPYAVVERLKTVRSLIAG